MAQKATQRAAQIIKRRPRSHPRQRSPTRRQFRPTTWTCRRRPPRARASTRRRCRTQLKPVKRINHTTRGSLATRCRTKRAPCGSPSATSTSRTTGWASTLHRYDTGGAAVNDEQATGVTGNCCLQPVLRAATALELAAVFCSRRSLVISSTPCCSCFSTSSSKITNARSSAASASLIATT